MKFIVLSVFLFGSVLAGGPYPPSGYKPQGPLLILPSQAVPSTYQGNEAQNVQDVSAQIMNRLRQEQGSRTGRYHVFLPDGRLQKIQYTTAPLRSNSQQNQYAQRYTNQGSFNGAAEVFAQGSVTGNRFAQEPNPTVANFGRYQYESGQQKQYQYSQYANRGQGSTNSRYVQEPNPSIVNFGSFQEQQKQQQPSNYVASVQFSDVEPIPAPIYSSNSSPLVRILRYAPQFQ